MEQAGFERVGDGHFAGGDLGFGGADEAQFAAAQHVGWFVALIVGGGHADGRTEDAAGHGAPGVDVAESCGGVEGGTRGFVGEVFESSVVGIGCAEEAGLGIAREVGEVFAEPGAGAEFEIGGEGGLGGAQRIHAGAEAEDVERIDGEGSVAALRAPGSAGEPGAGATAGFGERSIDDLHEFSVAWRKMHPREE